MDKMSHVRGSYLYFHIERDTSYWYSTGRYLVALKMKCLR